MDAIEQWTKEMRETEKMFHHRLIHGRFPEKKEES